MLPEQVCKEILAMEKRDLEETERLAKEGELEKCGYHPLLRKLHDTIAHAGKKLYLSGTYAAFTIKLRARANTLRGPIGVPGEARTLNEGVGGPCFIQLDYGYANGIYGKKIN